MRCPRCNETGTRVIDSRDLEAGSTIRRRRECEACSYRFTTYERPEGARLTVIKRDGSRQEFDREKVRAGLLKALQKRPVTLDRVDQAVDDIDSALRALAQPEITSREIGRLATEALRELDQLAYIRFASVYHSYEDISTLKREVDRLISQRQGSDECSSPTATSAPRSRRAGS
jgi:transcriptional repressor NrdR